MTARTRWIGIILVLLVGNVAATGGLIAASHHGGSRVLPSYDTRAVHYNDAIDRAERNAALGWTVDVRPVDGVLAVLAHDRGGAAIAGAHVHVDVVSRAPHGTSANLGLGEAAAGAYRASIALERGWYDSTITIDRGADTYTRTLAFEVK